MEIERKQGTVTCLYLRLSPDEETAIKGILEKAFRTALSSVEAHVAKTIHCVLKGEGSCSDGSQAY